MEKKLNKLINYKKALFLKKRPFSHNKDIDAKNTFLDKSVNIYNMLNMCMNCINTLVEKIN